MPQAGGQTSNASQPTGQRLLIAAGGALGVIGILGPRAMPVLLPLVLSAVAAFAVRRTGAERGVPAPGLVSADSANPTANSSFMDAFGGRFGFAALVWSAAVSWAAITLAWTPDLANGVSKVLTGALIAACVVALAAYRQRLAVDAVQIVLTATVVGAVLSFAVLCFEVFSDQALKLWVYNAVPELRGSIKDLNIRDNVVFAVGMQERNHSIAVANLLFWPLAGAFWLLRGARNAGAGGRRVDLLAIAGLWLVLAATTFASAHDTSKVAVLVGGSAVGMALVSVTWTRRALIAGWVAVFALIVPFVLALYANGVHRAPALEASAQARVILWAVTAQKWQERPITGIGVAGTRALDDRDKATAPWPDGYPYALRTGRHAHNVYLQTFYELGIVGAVLLAAGGIALIMATAGLASVLQPFAIAAFATSAAMMGLSWGMWQAWFQCAFAGVLILLILASV
ncbi:MAG: O-antigen ligase family protein, partial [Pseudomonadota bacterium]